MTRNHDDNSMHNFFKVGKLYRVSQRPDSILYASALGRRNEIHSNNTDDSYIFDRELIDKDDNVADFDKDDQAPFAEPEEDESLTGFGLHFHKKDYTLNPIHPATDDASNIDSTELYNEGLAGAVEASEPNAGSAVLNYDPSSDHRKPRQS
jgi:hypothetical protein